MAATSFLSKVGADFKAVFAWLGGSAGKAVITTVEGVAEGVATAFGAGAIVQAGINLINNWMAEAIKVEALAAAAGQQTGSGVTKAAAVVAAMAPEAVQFAAANGLPAPTATTLNTINTSVVAALNAIGALSTPATT